MAEPKNEKDKIIQPVNLNSFINEAENMPIDKASPNFTKGTVTEEQIFKIIQQIATIYSLEKSNVLVAIYLLFLKGAASAGTPMTLTVEVLGRSISKRDLLLTYEMVTNNKHLRRLAEALAEPIGKYAEKNGLRGELAQRIDNLLRSQTGEALSSKEQAWCSSFSQQLPNLAELSSERLAKWLAKDYNRKFGPNAKKQKNSPKNKGEKKETPKSGNKGATKNNKKTGK